MSVYVCVLRSCGLLCLQEHLILVCELLRANLYEFQKYQRENGDDPYFTPPRIQRIAIQVGGMCTWRTSPLCCRR